ncbi:metal-dependent hydrolase [Halospeciosus flavus]|uniref:Metal-dependent hydrolase n=1 Tax=Halospeciosus flavus TaxID=3032283 RepID=A0ABD5Z140_9EURY|nr:metal-dependent hydrolase [Halospeciosus flavus]
MWPWEHLAVGYVAVSILFRWHGRRVGALDAVAVGVGAAFPDLVDKPLAWAFDVLPSGTSVAHSVFVAVPLAVAVWFVAARRDRRSVGAAFAVSYLLHLPSDALYGPLTDGGFSIRAFLWPFVVGSGEGSGGFAGTVAHYFLAYLQFLGTPEAVEYLVFELFLLGTATVLWVADGAPPLDAVQRFVRRRTE